MNQIIYSFVIPTYNGAHFLPDCLQSIAATVKNSRLPAAAFEIIIIDNNSTDATDAIISSLKLTPPINLVYRQLDANFGFAKAVNTGIHLAQGKYIIVTNNDLTFKPDWFSLIHQTISDTTDPKTAVWCGTVLNIDGTRFESRGLAFEYKGKCQNIGNQEPFTAAKLAASAHQIWGSNAAVAVYHRQTLIDIGLFDQDFFAYEEDVDLALRMVNLGLKTIYTPKAIAYHLGGGTSKKMGIFRQSMDAKNWFYIIIKNYPVLLLLKLFFPVAIERLRNCSGLAKAVIATDGFKAVYRLPLVLISVYWQVLKHLPSMLRKRQTIKLLQSSYGYRH